MKKVIKNAIFGTLCFLSVNFAHAKVTKTVNNNLKHNSKKIMMAVQTSCGVIYTNTDASTYNGMSSAQQAAWRLGVVSAGCPQDVTKL